MSDRIGIVILAAGRGTRLQMEAPKPLVPLQGKKLIDFPLREAIKFLKENQLVGKICLVIGHQYELIKSHIETEYPEEKIDFVVQKEQKGTADAVKTFYGQCAWAKSFSHTLVICADTPLLTKKVFTALYDEINEKNKEGVAATFLQENPTGYGRIVRNDLLEKNALDKGRGGFQIVEEKDANKEVRQIKEVNSGVYFLKTQFSLEYLYQIDNKNKSEEFYLTDLFQKRLNVEAILFDGKNEKNYFLGINDLWQLEEASHLLKMKKMQELRELGVRFIDSRHTYIDDDVLIGRGSVIYPNVMIMGDTEIGDNVVVEAGSIIKDCVIAEQAIIKAYSHLEGSRIGLGAQLGPYARIRPNTIVGEDVKVGNFVETKKTTLNKGAKVSHLSYVGDAEIGENTNLGCGFITCNYDGTSKHKTIIGKNSFIGSDSQTVAPVTIGDECFVASGSTINKNMADGDFAISRGRQVIRPKLAKKFLPS